MYTILPASNWCWYWLFLLFARFYRNLLLEEGFGDPIAFQGASSAVKNTDVNTCTCSVVLAVPKTITTLDFRPVIPVPRGAYRKIIVSRTFSISLFLCHCFCILLSDVDILRRSINYWLHLHHFESDQSLHLFIIMFNFFILISSSQFFLFNSKLPVIHKWYYRVMMRTVILSLLLLHSLLALMLHHI